MEITEGQAVSLVYYGSEIVPGTVTAIDRITKGTMKGVVRRIYVRDEHLGIDQVFYPRPDGYTSGCHSVGLVAAKID